MRVECWRSACGVEVALVAQDTCSCPLPSRQETAGTCNFCPFEAHDAGARYLEIGNAPNVTALN